MRKIIISSLLVCIFLYIIEQVIQVNFIAKLSLKPLIFILVPLIIYGFKLKKEQFNFKNIKTAIFSGIIFFCVLIISYIILAKFIDFSTISNDLQNRYNITKAIFIWVGLYVIFINSFLEEFFFRGFIFLNLKNKNPKIAHIYSAFLFSLYHTSIFITWFKIPILALFLFGLFAVGILFNLMDQKNNSIIPSWISHIFADIAIIIIGLIMFGLI